MVKQAKNETENKTPVLALATMSKLTSCKDVNPHIESGKLHLDEEGLRFSIPSLNVSFTAHSILEAIIRDGLKKILSAYTAGFAKSGKVQEAIVDTINVWREGKFLTPSEKEKANKIPVLAGTGKAFKLPFGRVLIEGKLRDILGPDDVRVKKIESLNDDLFVALIEAKGNEGYLLQAITQLADEAKAKLEAEKASLLAEFGDLGL